MVERHAQGALLRPEDIAAKLLRLELDGRLPDGTDLEAWMAEHQVPVVVEVMLERVTNIAMGTEIDNVVEFEELAASPADAPTALALLD